jgi:acyl carrier protein
MTKPIEQEIAQYLRTSKKVPSHSPSPEESSDLYADGWLDSLSTLRLLSFLESTYSIKISPFKLNKKYFATLSSIANLVTSATNGK